MTQSFLHSLADRRIAYGSSGGGGQSQGTSTVVQNQEPWSGVQAPLQKLYTQAGQIADQPTSYFPNSTFAGLAPEHQIALGYQTQRAIQGSPLVAGAQDQLQSTMAGNYLGGNPIVNQALIPSLIGPQGDPMAQGQLNATASGGYMGGNPLASGAFSQYAAGLMGADPTAIGQYLQTALGQYAGGSQPAAQAYGGILSGELSGTNPLAQQQFQNVASGALTGGSQTGQGALEQTAQGGMLQNNPYIDQIIQRTQQNIAPQVTGSLAASGRYGSGTHAKALSDALAGAETGLRYQNYGQERQNQLAAAQQLMGQGNIDLSQRLGAAGALSGLSQQDIQNRMGAAGALQGQFAQGRGEQLGAAGALQQANLARQAGQLQGAGALQNQFAQERANQMGAAGQLSQNYFSGLGAQLGAANQLAGNYGQERQNQLNALQLAPTLANQDYFDAQQLAAVGDVYRNLSQQGINEQMARYAYQVGEPYQRASQFASLLQPGLGYGSSTATTTGTMPGTSPVSGLLGAGLAGAGIGGQFGGPLGAGIGGGIGALLGLFG